MVKGEQKKVEQTPEGNLEPETPPTEPQTISMTREELDAKVAEAKAEAMKEYQGIQRIIAKKDQEIEYLRGQTSKPRTSTPAYKALLDALEAGQDALGEPNPKLTLAKQIIAEEEKREAQEVVYRQQEAIANKAKDDLANKIKEANLNPEDEMFDDVWDAWDLSNALDGKFERAERKLSRILKNVKPPEKKEEDEEEIARKVLEKKGLLKSETGGPSGVSADWEQVRADFIKNPSNPRVFERYDKMRKERER